MWRILLPLMLMLLAGAGRSAPPDVERPAAGTERNFTVTGNGLTIQPSEDVLYLRFYDGVRAFNQEGHELRADVIEVDLLVEQVSDPDQFRLPEMPGELGHVTTEPGEAIASMARELEVPSARFNQSSIKRIGAKGGVVVSSEQVHLEMAELVSVDGGLSWSSDTRSRVWRDVPVTGEHFELSADMLFHDTVTSRTLVRGNITGKILMPDRPPLDFKAQRCEANFDEEWVDLSEGLALNYGSATLCCGSIRGDLESLRIVASDSPHLQDLQLGVTLDAEDICFDLLERNVAAEGHVRLLDLERGYSLVTENLYMQPQPMLMFIAEGSPTLNYGESYFTGRRIRVIKQDRQAYAPLRLMPGLGWASYALGDLADGGKWIIEVDGPQTAKIKQEDLDGGLPELRGEG